MDSAHFSVNPNTSAYDKPQAPSELSHERYPKAGQFGAQGKR